MVNPMKIDNNLDVDTNRFESKPNVSFESVRTVQLIAGVLMMILSINNTKIF